MIKKVILWGMGTDYENLLNHIRFEIFKKNMAVEAIICRKQDKYCSLRDGFPVITKEELKSDDFDYLIILSSKYFKEIKQEAVSMGISEFRIINGILLKQPLFDFERYTKLLENPVTILSDDCWGGLVYHKLQLPISSPVANTGLDAEDYSRFIQNPLYYLGTELTMLRDRNIKKGLWPIGQLGSHGDYIKIHLVHNTDFKEAKKAWNRRMQRINPNNIFVKSGLSASLNSWDTLTPSAKERYLNIFKSLPYNKILIYYEESLPALNGLFNTERFFWHRRATNFLNFNEDYNEYFKHNSFYDLDLLKLLTGEADYSRYSDR